VSPDPQARDGLAGRRRVVPITPHERHLLLDHGRTAFRAYTVREEIDLFADRTDPP
jgi:hypothetical protein